MIPPHVREALRAALPDANLDAAEAIGEGWNATAWRVPEPGGDRVVRVPRAARYSGEIERQSCLYRELAAEGLPVPRDAVALRGGDGNVVAGVYRFVEGEPAARNRNIGRRRRRMARDLGRFLTALHAFPVGRARACGVGERDKWARYVEWMARHDAHFGPRTRGWLHWVRKEWTTLGGAKGVRPTLVHADLEWGHLLVDERGTLLAVLDFSGPQVTDPAIDFGTIAEHYGTSFARQVLACYEGRTDAGLLRRAELYAAVSPLHSVDAGVEREQPHLLRLGLRRLGARAAAATRTSR